MNDQPFFGSTLDGLENSFSKSCFIIIMELRNIDKYIFYCYHEQCHGRLVVIFWVAKKTLPSPEKVSLRKHSKMRTSDNKEPNFLVATSNTNMCSHPHTVCTESVGQGYGSFTAQLDRQDTQRVKDSEIMCCSSAQIKTRGRKSHIPFMLRGTKPLLTRTHSILHTVPGVCVDPRGVIKIIHTSMYQFKGRVYSSPSLKLPTRM